MSEPSQHTLDVMGLRCPLPILRTKKMLATLNSGDQLKILATDDDAPNDIAAFCEQTGHTLLSSQTLSNHTYEILIQKK